MRYGQLLKTLQGDPLFETALLTAGDATPYHAQRRLTDWTNAGKVFPLRRGLYLLPKAERRYQPHPFQVANRLVAGSYISLEMALGYYSLIPEHVALITSVTTGRPQTYENEFGRFRYHHLQPRLFFGITYLALGKGQSAYVAYPEKALLDLIYLRKGGDSPAFLASLRLQNLERLNLQRLKAFAVGFNKPKITRAVQIIQQLAEAETAEYETL
jgi:predicted transcriptional regulator of viral defense system